MTRTEVLLPSQSLLTKCSPAEGEKADGTPEAPMAFTEDLINSRQAWINAWGKCASKVDRLNEWYDRRDPK